MEMVKMQDYLTSTLDHEQNIDNKIQMNAAILHKLKQQEQNKLKELKLQIPYVSDIQTHVAETRDHLSIALNKLNQARITAEKLFNTSKINLNHKEKEVQAANRTEQLKEKIKTQTKQDLQKATEKLEMSALRSLTYEMSNVWQQLASSVSIHVQRSQIKVEEKKLNVTTQRRHYDADTVTYQHANRTVSKAIRVVKNVNKTTKWMNIIQSTSSNNQKQINTLKLFVNKITTAEKMNAINNNGDTHTDGLSSKQIVEPSMQKDSIPDLKHALTMESVALQAAHGAATHVQYYLTNLQIKVSTTVSKMYRNIQQTLRTNLEHNHHQINNVNNKLNNRTSEIIFQNIVQNGVDIMHIKETIKLKRGVMEDRLKETMNVKQAIENPLNMLASTSTGAAAQISFLTLDATTATGTAMEGSASTGSAFTGSASTGSASTGGASTGSASTGSASAGVTGATGDAAESASSTGGVTGMTGTSTGGVTGSFTGATGSSATGAGASTGATGASTGASTGATGIQTDEKEEEEEATGSTGDETKITKETGPYSSKTFLAATISKTTTKKAPPVLPTVSPIIQPTIPLTIQQQLAAVDLSLDNEGDTVITNLLLPSHNRHSVISQLLLHPPSPTVDMLLHGARNDVAQDDIRSLQIHLQKLQHYKETALLELKKVSSLENMVTKLKKVQMELNVNASIADMQHEHPCQYPPFYVGVHSEYLMQKKMKTLCKMIRVMKKDVHQFTSWNKGLDLNLPGGYSHAMQTIPGLTIMLTRNDSAHVRTLLTNALHEAALKTHERRMVTRAVSRRAIAVAARERQQAFQLQFEAKVKVDNAEIQMKQAEAGMYKYK